MISKKKIFPLFFFLSFNLFAVCTKGFTQLYSGPGEYFSKLWEVPPHTPLKIYKSKGKWYKVQEVDTVVSWVKKSDVTKKNFCGIVKKSVVKGKKKGKTTRIRFNSNFKILKFKRKWTKVLNQKGETLWVRKKDLWVF